MDKNYGMNLLQIKHIEAEIADQFLSDDNHRPWIIGFSGGKDSTMLLQLVWSALEKHVPIDLRHSRKVYIVCNNTLVENPKILEYTDKILDKIEKASPAKDMPFIVQRTQPKLEDTFWINLIGKGYPAPNKIFRWCTERLKISPTTRFILEKVNENGEVILLLGTRAEESSNRAKTFKRHEFGNHRLRRHILPNSYVYTPIKEITTQEVWEYLMQVPSPWGAQNRDLVTIYRNASGGDCPLVIDTTTPSCGNSRFGCWVCTVVSKDKSMEALIDNGEEWMLPLLELRDLLAESRDRFDWRETTRRDGSDGAGPYKPHIRAMFLEKLLRIQKELQEEDSSLSLISNQELVAIQVVWYRDSIFTARVADIYNRVYSSKLAEMDKLEQQHRQEEKILSSVCTEHPEDVQLINELLALHKSKILLRKKRGLSEELETQLERFIKNTKGELETA